LKSASGSTRAHRHVPVESLAGTAAAQSQSERGIDPNQGESLDEVNLPSKSAAERLQLGAESYGVDFELAALDLAGYDLGRTIEGPDTWRARIAERRAEVKAESRAEAAALDEPITTQSHEDEIVLPLARQDPGGRDRRRLRRRGMSTPGRPRCAPTLRGRGAPDERGTRHVQLRENLDTS
jgi:hypothetical protein